MAPTLRRHLMQEVEMPGIITEAMLQDSVLPSYEEMEFLPQEDDLYAEVFGHHEPLHSGIRDEEWEEGY